MNCRDLIKDRAENEKELSRNLYYSWCLKNFKTWNPKYNLDKEQSIYLRGKSIKDILETSQQMKLIRGYALHDDECYLHEWLLDSSTRKIVDPGCDFFLDYFGILLGKKYDSLYSFFLDSSPKARWEINLDAHVRKHGWNYFKIRS